MRIQTNLSPPELPCLAPCRNTGKGQHQPKQKPAPPLPATSPGTNTQFQVFFRKLILQLLLPHYYTFRETRHAKRARMIIEQHVHFFWQVEETLEHLAIRKLDNPIFKVRSYQHGCLRGYHITHIGKLPVLRLEFSKSRTWLHAWLPIAWPGNVHRTCKLRDNGLRCVPWEDQIRMGIIMVWPSLRTLQVRLPWDILQSSNRPWNIQTLVCDMS